MPTRTRLLSIVAVIALAASLFLCLGGVATAGYKLPKPRAGAWKFEDAVGGFSLRKGKGKNKGKLFLANVHSFTQNFSGCPLKSERITVAGRFPLKLLGLAGYPGYRAWGVGKTGKETRYSDDNQGIVSIPAKVRVDGKLVEGGAIKMDFSGVEENTFNILIIEFGPNDRPPCVTYSRLAHHG